MNLMEQILNLLSLLILRDIVKDLLKAVKKQHRPSRKVAVLFNT